MGDKVFVVYSGSVHKLIVPEYGLTMTRGEPFECSREIFDALKSGPNGNDYTLSTAPTKQAEKK
jgi:hypothetical protein